MAAGGKLWTRSGAPVVLAERIGGGGEGAVYAVRGRGDVVAKLYASPTQERRRKLEAMVAQRPPALAEITAWPSDLVLSGGGIVGFLMPRAVQAEEAHVLYGPKSRKQRFPDADYQFLVHAAMNLARAFAVVHRHGIVIGDVNERVAMVARNGTVRLIDCDSFQIRAGAEIFRCEVGVPLFTPPELQTVPTLRGIERTEQHDLFGLAVLVFHLLFLGRHPYSGRNSAQPDMTIETAIKEHRFAYSAERHRTRMAEPANASPLMSAGADIARLFEQAFAPAAAAGAAGRPAASQWADALEALAATLRPCRENAAHAYGASLPACPWCTIEMASGIELFNWVEPAGSASPPVDVEAIWRAIEAMPVFDPAPVPEVQDLQDQLQPSPEARLIAETRGEQARFAAARATREAAEQEVEARQAVVKAADDEIVRAREHVAGFDADKARIPELQQRYDAARAKVQRYQLTQRIALAAVAVEGVGAWLYGWPYGAALLAMVFCIVVVVSDAVLARERNGAIGRATELAALRASVDLGPAHRQAKVDEAVQALDAAKQALIAAQGRVYQAMLEETAVKAAARVPPDALAAARHAIEARFLEADRRYQASLARRQALREQLDRMRPALVARKEEVASLCARLREIEGRRAEERRRAREKAYAEQLAHYLDQFFVARESWGARLPRTVLAALSSYGVETAADITAASLDNVPGVGEVRTRLLLEWRRAKEATFRFDPAQSGGAAAIQAADRRLTGERRLHERALQAAAARLEALAAEPAQQLAALETELADGARTLAQALKDMAVLGADIGSTTATPTRPARRGRTGARVRVSVRRRP